jgi:hypothetical protein
MSKYLLIIFLFLAACTNEKEALRVLEQEGVSNIKFTGYDWFACSKDDTYQTGFTGTRNGREISGVICSGLIFKRSTVRY